MYANNKVAKKMSVVLGILFMGLMLTACGDSNGESEENGEGAAVETSDASEAGFSMQRGEWDGDTFTNVYSEISFDLPEGFTTLSDDMLEGMMGIGMDLMSEDLSDAERQLADMAIDTMVVVDVSISNWQDSVTVIYSSDLVMFDHDDLDSYLRAQVESREVSFDVEATYELSSQTIGGNTFHSLVLEYDWMGGVYREMMLVRQEGNYLISISIVSQNPEEMLVIFN